MKKIDVNFTIVNRPHYSVTLPNGNKYSFHKLKDLSDFTGFSVTHCFVGIKNKQINIKGCSDKLIFSLEKPYILTITDPETKIQTTTEHETLTSMIPLTGYSTSLIHNRMIVQPDIIPDANSTDPKYNIRYAILNFKKLQCLE